jgi:hypothetical protein
VTVLKTLPAIVPFALRFQLELIGIRVSEFRAEKHQFAVWNRLEPRGNWRRQRCVDRRRQHPVSQGPDGSR